jgi:hypothetical protein
MQPVHRGARRWSHQMRLSEFAEQQSPTPTQRRNEDGLFAAFASQSRLRIQQTHETSHSFRQHRQQFQRSAIAPQHRGFPGSSSAQTTNKWRSK